MVRKSKKRYVKATVDGQEHAFEFDVEELENKHLVAEALGRPLSAVKAVSPNSASTSPPGWYRTIKTNRHQFQVDYKVRRS